MLSLFVPVTASVPQVAQNAVRHRRVVARALERWRELGAGARELERADDELRDFARETSSPAAKVSARVAFWSADQGVRVFGLPFSCEESARVASCACVRPVLRAAQRPDRYRVLVLSINRVALYEGDEDGLAQLPATGLPESLEAALGSELSEPSLQFHGGRGAGAPPIYHGQGGAARDRRVDLERFHRRVARGLEAELAPRGRLPLVLAADEIHRPGLERALSREVGLLPGELQLAGNVEHLSEAALHAATWPLVVEARRGADAGAGADAGGAPLLTRPSEIAEQAVMGRIRRLRVPASGRVPGRLDPGRGAAAEAWGDDDLIEDLAVEVLRRGGSVEVVEREDFLANPKSLAAELR